MGMVRVTGTWGWLGVRVRFFRGFRIVGVILDMFGELSLVTWEEKKGCERLKGFCIMAPCRFRKVLVGG
jgi:hypothetical protein